MEKRLIFIIHQDIHEARGTKEILTKRLDRHQFEVQGKVVSHAKTIADCRNFDPAIILIKREIVLKKEFGNLTKILNSACPSAKIFVFDDERHLNKILGKYFKKSPEEVKHVRDFGNSGFSGTGFHRSAFIY